MGPWAYAQLIKEMGAQYIGHGNVLDVHGTMFPQLNTPYGLINIVVVQESKADFLLVGTEDDYLSYVVERTVL